MQQKQTKKGGGQMPRRILSLLLALVMGFSLFSVGSLTTIAAELQDLEGVAGSNVTGNAQDGYTVERIENQNNFVGSSAKVEAFTYEADMLISPDGSRKSTMVFGAAESGGEMSHPFFGMEVSAQPNNDKYDLYLTMFCELAVANPVYLFMNVPAGSGVDLTQPQHVEITVTPDKEFSVSINNTSVPVQMTANFADYYNGGYLGFMTYDTQAVFSNVKYSDEGSFVLDDGLTDLAGVVGNNVTGDAASGYTVAREEGQNNFVGSSTKVNAFTYEADILFKGGSNKATLTFGAPNEGAEMSHPFLAWSLLPLKMEIYP
ncbi:hypothetical protein WGC32_06605 [Zongyangia sp. HA2173]|uniref:hypothetical protein n=1 Tax=Zongyangia sp. HA2173 TaxID=3133035 RepID=UPI0031625145